MFTGLLGIGLLIVKDMHVEFRVVEGRFMSPAVRGGGAVGRGVLVTAEGGLTTLHPMQWWMQHFILLQPPGPAPQPIRLPTVRILLVRSCLIIER